MKPASLFVAVLVLVLVSSFGCAYTAHVRGVAADEPEDRPPPGAAIRWNPGRLPAGGRGQPRRLLLVYLRQSRKGMIGFDRQRSQGSAGDLFSKYAATILDSTADGIFTVDHNWKITSFNRAAERITGFTREQAVGRYCFDIFRTEICQTRCALRHTLADGQSVSDVRVTIMTRDGRLAGIFTERDVFLRVLGNDGVLQQPVSELMSAEPVSVSRDEPVWRVVTLMHRGGYRQIPVVDGEGRVTGCVRHKDIAGYLVDHFAGHILNLPPDPDQLARTPDGG